MLMHCLHHNFVISTDQLGAHKMWFFSEILLYWQIILFTGTSQIQCNYKSDKHTATFKVLLNQVGQAYATEAWTEIVQAQVCMSLTWTILGWLLWAFVPVFRAELCFLYTYIKLYRAAYLCVSGVELCVSVVRFMCTELCCFLCD